MMLFDYSTNAISFGGILMGINDIIESYLGRIRKSYLREIAAAGLTLVLAGGCRNKDDIPRVHLTIAQINEQIASSKVNEILGIQEDGSIRLRAYDGSVEPVPYTGSRTDPNDPNARINLEGEWNRMLFTGKDMPTDPTKIMVKTDTSGNYVSASYVDANGNDKQVNAFAVQLANLFVRDGLPVDANGNGNGVPALLFEKYVIQFNRWTDGDFANYEIDKNFGIRYIHDDGTPAQNLNGMFRFTFTKDPNYDPSKALTYNVKLTGGMGGSFATASAAKEYFVKNVLFPLLKEAYIGYLSQGLSDNQLHGAGVRLKDTETPRPLN